jgi:broad-specificity NMP kinase
MSKIIPTSFSDIPYDLYKEIRNSIDNGLIKDCIMILSDIYKSTANADAEKGCGKHININITGNIGAGKSTTCEVISKLIGEELIKNGVRFVKFPEYIRAYMYGEEMLRLRAEKIISVETFQHYILDYWELVLDYYKYASKKSVNIFERLPEDSIYCFAKIAHEEHEISDEGWNRLIHRYNDVQDRFHCIESKDTKTFVVSNEGSISKTVEAILKIIRDFYKDAASNVSSNLNLTILLKVSQDTLKERIEVRNRDSEKKLENGYLNSLNDYYA